MFNKKYILVSIILLVAIGLTGLFIIEKGKVQKPDIPSSPNISARKDTTFKTISYRMPATDTYGLSENGIHIVSGRIKRNQNLDNLLRHYNVSPRIIYELTQQSRGVFNVRGIRAGHHYHLYLENDSLNTAKHLVYEENPVDYVIFDLTRPYNVSIGHRKITEVTKEASGLIESSLYETLDQNNIDPALAENLADVFAWQIDFYHLQKGDQFKVIYTKEMIDGNSVGIGNIQAAYFEQGGHPYYAFRFRQDKKIDYFDLNGNSLRKAFLKAPLRYKYISSRFSYHRYHPVLHRYMPHLGVDFAAPRGTPIHSVGDGVIEVAKYNRYDGNYIKIRHNSEYQTEYLHMSHFAKGIHPGVHVKQGQLIGYVGSTGLATGPHLDYRIWKYGREVNPLKIDLPSSNPIDKKNKQGYYRQMGLLLSQLNGISIHKNIKNHFAAGIDTVQQKNSTDPFNNAGL